MKSKLLPFITALFLFFIIFLPTHTYALGPFDGCSSSSINTALGCIPTGDSTTIAPFVDKIITTAVGLGGGFALLLMLYGVFIVTTSAGIPDKLKEGSEIITSAITGLLFIILSVFLFKLIGINILALPGLV